jgi:L-rhamnose mutarotase
MCKTLFTINYKIIPEKREEYLDVVRELKNLMKADGLEKYSVFEMKNDENAFEEIYLFESKEAFEDFDDDPDERVDLLMNKLSDMIVDHSTHYKVLHEI